VCRIRSDFRLLSRVFESTGRTNDAIRLLLDSGYYEEALETSRRVGDAEGEASALEKLGRIGEARAKQANMGAQARKKSPEKDPAEDKQRTLFE
jgi:hypothetical protein